MDNMNSNSNSNSSSNSNSNSKGSKKLMIIVFLIIFIAIISIGVIIIKKDMTNGNEMEANNDDESFEEVNDSDESVFDDITTEDALEILKSSYNDVVRSLFNEVIPYCGEYSSEYINLSSPLGSLAYKSLTFNTFEELDNYVKVYVTENLLNMTDYYKSNTITLDDGEEITYYNYYEEEDGLYCNNWNKGSNLERVDFIEDESEYEITLLDDNLIEGKIMAVYNDNSSNKNVVNIEVELIYEDNEWKLDSYEEIG